MPSPNSGPPLPSPAQPRPAESALTSEQLLPILYGELRKLAQHRMAQVLAVDEACQRGCSTSCRMPADFAR
jgi:hypothetical protein